MARLTLETLIKDGRVHPTRIEEVYDKVCKETKEKILEYGNSALFELGNRSSGVKFLHNNLASIIDLEYDSSGLRITNKKNATLYYSINKI